MAKAPKPKRWLVQHLPVSHRHSIQYDYYVTGHGPFPVDMLRHDCAWPLTSGDAAKIEWSFIREDRMKTVSIKLRSYRVPTVDRWSSFLWSVGTENLEPRHASNTDDRKTLRSAESAYPKA